MEHIHDGDMILNISCGHYLYLEAIIQAVQFNVVNLFRRRGAPLYPRIGAVHEIVSVCMTPLCMQALLQADLH